MLEIVRRRMSAPFSLRAACAVGLLGACLAAIAGAEPLAPERVPEPLRPWIDWVLRKSSRTLSVPERRGGRPRMRLARGGSSSRSGHAGQLVQRWRVHADAWVPLPGDASTGRKRSGRRRPAPVIAFEGRLSVRLAAGGHELRGEPSGTHHPSCCRSRPRRACSRSRGAAERSGVSQARRAGASVAAQRRPRDG
jgi:hypothetical protein